MNYYLLGRQAAPQVRPPRYSSVQKLEPHLRPRGMAIVDDVRLAATFIGYSFGRSV
jgi:hypothetical protein